jgi:hypothetical protein
MRTKSLIKINPLTAWLTGFTKRRYLKAWALVTLLVLIAPVAASALTTLSQGFLTSGNLSLGSIVSLQNNSTDHVDAAKTGNVGSILGVVINADNSLLSVSNGQDNQVQVATSGIVQVLASDINGDISQGDQITASPIDGVGMKATNNVKVVGIAQGNLGSNSGTSRQDYTDKSGHKHTVRLGQVPVLINVSYYYKQPDKTVIPSAIQNVANALAGKSVNSAPILISAAIFIITLIVVVSIIYSMIRGSIISVGRNPMSQSAVYRDLVQMSALVLVILALAFGSIYLILTRF